MARLTSLVSRDERIGLDGELDKGQTSRQEVRIGRLDLEGHHRTGAPGQVLLRAVMVGMARKAGVVNLLNLLSSG